MDTSRDIREFRNILSSVGASAALAYLNAGVDHRYTAAYRLNGRQFENVLLHDKQSEVVPEFLVVVPFDVSFCQFVLRDGVFRTSTLPKTAGWTGTPTRV